MVFILLPSFVEGWNSNYHRSLAETVYYHLDPEIRGNLNLSLIKYGATSPDLVFHDTRFHHYPISYGLAERWLIGAKLNYSLKEYNKASYSFGVASHYISDSFVAPHYVSREPGSLHSEFENINYKFKSKCNANKIDLNQSLYLGSLNQEDWAIWLLSKNKNIPEKEVEEALSVLYPISLETFNSSCNNIETEISKKSYFNFKNVFYILIITFPIYFLIRKFFKN